MNDSLFYYDNKKQRIVGKHLFPYLPDDNFLYKYNPVKKIIFATHGGGGGQISYLDLEKKIWDNYFFWGAGSLFALCVYIYIFLPWKNLAFFFIGFLSLFPTLCLFYSGGKKYFPFKNTVLFIFLVI